MADFTNPFTWLGLFGLAVPIVGQWFYLRTLTENRLTDDYNDDIISGIRRRAGWLVLTNATVVAVINVILHLALWLIFFFRIADGPNADTGDSNAFFNYYAIELSLTFVAAAIFHKLAITLFNDLVFFGLSCAFHVLAWLAYLVAAIVASIELANLPSPLPDGETSTEEIVFVVILWIFFVWETVLAVRAGFYSSVDNELGPDSGERRLLSTSKPNQTVTSQSVPQFHKTAVQQRAAHVLNQQ